jgi:hypothetical protein
MIFIYYIPKQILLMQILRKIHKTLYNYTNTMYRFNISKFDIKITDNNNDILNKIDILSFVLVNPDHYMILKSKIE